MYLGRPLIGAPDIEFFGVCLGRATSAHAQDCDATASLNRTLGVADSLPFHSETIWYRGHRQTSSCTSNVVCAWQRKDQLFVTPSFTVCLPLTGESSSKVYGIQCRCAAGSGVGPAYSEEQIAIGPYSMNPVDTLLGVSTEIRCRLKLTQAMAPRFSQPESSDKTCTSCHDFFVIKSSRFNDACSSNSSTCLDATINVPANIERGRWSVASLPRSVGSYVGQNLTTCFGSKARGGEFDDTQACTIEPNGTMTFTDHRMSGQPFELLHRQGAIDGNGFLLELVVRIRAALLRETDSGAPYTHRLQITYASSVQGTTFEEIFHDEMTIRLHVAAEAVASRSTYIGYVMPEADVVQNDSTEPFCYCSNTCYTANDGICDDGGQGGQFAVCAEGTDCSDCGPRNINGADLALFASDRSAYDARLSTRIASKSYATTQLEACLPGAILSLILTY